MMYRATVTRQTEIVASEHPLSMKKSMDGAAYLPEVGCGFTLFGNTGDKYDGLRTTAVQAILGSTYKEDGKTFDTVTFKTKNTTYVMKIHSEVK